MPFLIQTEIDKLARVFGTELLLEKSANYGQIEKDIGRAPFLGNLVQAKQHLKKWNSLTPDEIQHYTQGNIDASNLSLILDVACPLINNNGPIPEITDEIITLYKEQVVKFSFAYINDKQQPCGLMILFRKDDPTQWMIALTENNTTNPQARKVSLLSSFDLKNKMVSSQPRIANEQVTQVSYNKFLEQIGNPFIKELLKNAVHLGNTNLDKRCARIQLLLRPINSSDQNAPITDPLIMEDISPQRLFAPNPVLDFLIQYNLSISSAMLKQCMEEGSVLRQEIENTQFAKDAYNGRRLQMVIAFHEAGILQSHRVFLQEHVFAKLGPKATWNNAQIKLIPLLIKKGYDGNLFDLILSNPAFYNAVDFLMQRKIMQDVNRYLVDPNPLKKNLLIYIDSLTDLKQKQLCLVLWAKLKPSVTEAQLKRIVKACDENVLLADLLLSMDNDSTVTPEGLLELAMDPNKHLSKSIRHKFAAEFALYGLDKKVLKSLDLTNQNALIKSYDVLNSAKLNNPSFYKAALNNDKTGELLRLILPTIFKGLPTAHIRGLVEMLYIGANAKHGGIAKMGQEVNKIKDTLFLVFGRLLLQSFTCVKHLQDLNADPKHLLFAAEDSGKAQHFRAVILGVEKKCAEIREQLALSTDTAERQKIKDWQKIEVTYRQSLYAIAYNKLMDPTIDAAAELERTTKSALDIVDPDIHSWVHKTLVAIANVFISILSLGIANAVKYQQTSNLWFFNQTSSGEKVRELDKELQEVIKNKPPTN